ncbi:long-chain acyl-CoA synthetase [Ruminococcus albus SY3]|uniref:Long-chain acyl-CoA synthetase n=1 Tax=Ruminococcus albus SY3 TaxID=1341156 RepID=A0A011WLN7_RUMAL|nr:class I adenylate-forming enzyme family protein [Ruminococcus albus]EXM37945.1 long-chain acyl-CoA synthetase [Ruminococcus albus SY3]
MSKNFFDYFSKYAQETPNKILLRIDENTLTYSRFMEKTAVFGSALKKMGIGVDDKVGLVMPNSIEWYIAFWSAVRIGAQPVPIDPQSGSLELSRLIPSTTVKMLFVSEKYRTNHIINAVEKIVPEEFSLSKVVCFAPENAVPQKECFISAEKFTADFGETDCDIYQPEYLHTMSLACTSGSTGAPKILAIPSGGFLSTQKDMGDYLEFKSDDVMMLGMTLYHQGGFGMGLQMALKGGSVMYQPQFNPISFLETIQKYKVNIIQLTSTLAKVLLSTPDFDKYDLSSVRICYFAGEVLPKEIADTFVKKLNIRVINIIGSSETCTMVVWDSAKDGDTDPSDFKKLYFTDYRVIDADKNDVAEGETGELCVYTDGVITEYFGNPELSAEKILTDSQGRRWFCTGDLVNKLPGGIVRFAGRSKRIIKRGGNLVHAEEVEACLLTHPKIAAAAVTDEPHPIIGQQIVAYIQPKGDEKITRGELARYFDGKLSSYKVPDKVIPVEEIPKDIGKIQFKYLRKKEYK